MFIMSQDFQITMTFVSKEDLATLTTAGISFFLTRIYSQNLPFIALFVFRYLRLIVHTISFWLYKPVPVPQNPTILRSDCTVIIPINNPDPTDTQFTECLRTILANKPAEVMVSTVGEENLEICTKICARLNAKHGNKIKVIQQSKANKRVQVCHAIPFVQTGIVVSVDATVFWPSTRLLPALFAPFEDPQVAVVGTYKRVVREPTGFSLKSFWNFIGCLYLERHNFEVAATSNVDGGAFVISGRTAAYRTEVFADTVFQEGFTNEKFFFGKLGPLNPDDDNFITRWVVRHGWKVKFQYSEDAMIQTRVGTYPKFLSQCLRWVRTTWRSNSASLFTDPFRADCVHSVWRSQPWCVYAVYITSFFNFALFTDAGLMYLVSTTTFVDVYGLSFVWKCMAAWIFASKLVKPFPHFWRNPVDLVFLPGYILFGYYHSLIKLYALLTFWDCAWSGRKVEDAKSEDIDDIKIGKHFSSPTDIKVDDGFDLHGRPQRNSRPATNFIDTPWGAVKTISSPFTSANAHELQIPGYLGKLRGGGATPSKPVTSKSRSSPANNKPRTPPKLSTWTRPPNCERLHSEGYNFTPVRQWCELDETRDLGYTGRSRPWR